jgi:hypothetical protein
MIDPFVFTDPSSSWNKEINQEVEPREVAMVKATATATKVSFSLAFEVDQSALLTGESLPIIPRFTFISFLS